MTEQKLITLSAFGCSSLILEKKESPAPEGENHLGIDLLVLPDAGDPARATVRFRLDAYHAQAGMRLKADYDCLFETNFDPRSELEPEKIFRVNAAAIAFPYFRAYISQITLLSGFPPLILPTYNFSS